MEAWREEQEHPLSIAPLDLLVQGLADLFRHLPH